MASAPAPTREVTPLNAAAESGSERPLLDIRSPAERNTGYPAGSIAMAPEEVRRLAAATGHGKLAAGFVLCAGGVRSASLVESLHQAGCSGFASVAGGFRAWREAGLPAVYPQGFDAASAERYARHLVMPQVGPAGQRKLLASRVLLVGAGGLSSPAALYLAAAGVGTLGLVDDDRVERSNLQRQIVHADASVGTPKVVSAGARIQALNPGTCVVLMNDRVSDANAGSIVAGWDVVLDGSDDFPTRYALNRACLEHGIPLVYGAVSGFQGQVAVFWRPDGQDDLPCFRCLHPAAPTAEDAPSCAAAGVLGVMPGIVGTLQACEVLKLLLGIGRPLLGQVLLLDALGMDFRQARLPRRVLCPDCGR